MTGETAGPAGEARTPVAPALDARLDRVLRVFARASAALLGLGLVAALTWPGALPPRVLLHAGLIVLLASPGARLVVIVIVHAHRRQWKMAALASLALAIMTASLVAGLLALRRGGGP